MQFEFIDYSGCFPNLCAGKLTFKADGKQYAGYVDIVSGGDVWFDDRWSEHVEEGHVSVPAEFLIGIPVFEDGPAYTIRAKLRYRIDRSSGELRLWYELQQLQRVFAKAIEANVQKLEELLSGELPIYSGR